MAFQKATLYLSLQRISLIHFFRLFLCFSTIYGFFALNEVYNYMPWPRGAIKSLEWTILAHLGLGLATLPIKSQWRFLIVPLLITSGVGVYFLLWNRSIASKAVAVSIISWLIFRLMKGSRFES
jgi:hypothetical protein